MALAAPFVERAAERVAAAFVSARRTGTALSAFPGAYPASLEDAYAIQTRATVLSGGRIAGWKVGRLTPSLADRFGVDRFIGPVFAASVQQVVGEETVPFPIFTGGSAAFEAEYVVVLDADQPAGREWDATAVHALVGQVRTGVEIAGSPLAIMAELNSLASIADAGNNNGQIIGPVIPTDILAEPTRMTCTTIIDGVPVHSATAADLPGGPLTALAFALSQAERLGLPLRAGQFISTGAVTGMHAVHRGQRAIADFGPWGRIQCKVAEPRSDALS